VNSQKRQRALCGISHREIILDISRDKFSKNILSRFAVWLHLIVDARAE
jgi:hypothetical protein